MDDFTNVLKKGTMIFKGSSESQIQDKLNQHCWFAISKPSAVQQVDVPSCFHGGLFASELCICNCNGKVRQVEKLEYKRQTANMTGGADAIVARENYVGDDWNTFMKRYIKATGYKGKVKYDSNGKIEKISFEDIMKDREIQILKQSKKEYAKLKKQYKVSK